MMMLVVLLLAEEVFGAVFEWPRLRHESAAELLLVHFHYLHLSSRRRCSRRCPSTAEAETTTTERCLGGGALTLLVQMLVFQLLATMVLLLLRWLDALETLGWLVTKQPGLVITVVFLQASVSFSLSLLA